MLFDVNAVSTLMHAILTILFGITLLRAPDKTRASRLLGAMFMASALMMTARFLSHIFPFHSVQVWAILPADLIHFVVSPLLLLFFAYSFPANFPNRTRRETLLVSTFLFVYCGIGLLRFGLSWYGLSTGKFVDHSFHMFLFQLFLALHILGFFLLLWIITVLVRQTVYWSSKRKEGLWWQHLLSPANRNARASRAMVVVLLLCLGLAMLAMLLQVTPLKVIARPLSAILFALLFFSLGMTYLSYSPESSSLLSKIVLSSIGTLLVLVSLVGYLYVPHLKATYQSPHRPSSQKSWRFVPVGKGYKVQHTRYGFHPPQGKVLSIKTNKSKRVELPFAFPYFGRKWRTLHVNSRGLITLGVPLAPLLYQQIISKVHTQPMIAPLAMDHQIGKGSHIFVRKMPKKLWITWSKVLDPVTGKAQSFQLELLQTGEFAFHYKSIRSNLIKLVGFQSGIPQRNVPVGKMSQCAQNKTLLMGGLHENYALDFRSKQHDWTYGLVVLMIVFSGLVFIGFWWLFQYGVVKPLNSLIAGVTQVNSGELDVSLPTYFQDEIGFLTQSFNQMVVSLKKADQLKDEFLANTSHELRTPLNGIIGIAESLHDGVAGELSPTALANLDMIVQSGRRLTHLVNDILDFSKIKHNAMELNQTPLDLRALTDVVLQLSKPLLLSKAVTLHNEIPVSIPLTYADEDRVYQILHNLVGNAIKFTEEGEVVLTAQEEDEWVALSVKDTGIGIPLELQEKIFEAFAQADGSTVRQFGGTGLGLTVTHHLVMLHGGTLTVDSAPGKGSTFTLTLPRASEGASAEKPKHKSHLSQLHTTADERIKEIIATESVSVLPSRSSGSPQRQKSSSDFFPAALGTIDDIFGAQSERSFHVLIVDDEPINLQVLDNYLSMEDYVSYRAESGEKALELLSNGLVPDLILLDVMMPKMSGYELCIELRKRYPANELPVVLVTAKNQVDNLVEGFGVGANDYLTKPVSKRELLARVETHLRLSRINQAASRFVPFEFLALLGKESLIEVQLGDQVQKKMTVLFSDIRSFTTLSEKMTPEENFAFINEYLIYMEPEVHAHNGFIDKYIGDAVMALFGESAEDGLNAAIGMVRALAVFNQDRAARGEEAIAIGIGLNTGLLMLGTIGGKERMDGTVISDAVNLAARVEGMTKHYGAAILISEFTLRSLETPESYQMRLVDKVQVKGKEKPVMVYDVFDGDLPDLLEKKQVTLADHEAAMDAYILGDFVLATTKFQAVLSRFPEDKTAHLYIERCQAMQQQELPKDWDGVTRLTSK